MILLIPNQLYFKIFFSKTPIKKTHKKTNFISKIKKVEGAANDAAFEKFLIRLKDDLATK